MGCFQNTVPRLGIDHHLVTCLAALFQPTGKWFASWHQPSSLSISASWCAKKGHHSAGLRANARNTFGTKQALTSTSSTWCECPQGDWSVRGQVSHPHIPLLIDPHRLDIFSIPVRGCNSHLIFQPKNIALCVRAESKFLFLLFLNAHHLSAS